MEKVEEIKKLTEEVLKYVGANAVATVSIIDESTYQVTIEGEDLSYLIGYRGEAIDALQTFLNLALYKKFGDAAKVVVEINGYRKQRQEKIEQIARNFIDRVRFLDKDIEMPPMNPFERKTVHTFVATYTDVTSESVGDGHNRRVVLKPKK